MVNATLKRSTAVFRFTWRRFWAVVKKEFVQMRRDRLTFAMMIGVPLIQLTLFGYAINANPKQLPTALIVADHSVFSRSFAAALQNSDYFALRTDLHGLSEANAALQRGDVQFIIEIPADFNRRLLRGERPELHISADASDPSATGNAVAALQQLGNDVFKSELRGAIGELANTPNPIELRLHKRYNPEGITQYNIVPGLMGVVLTMTMIMMTALAITKESERGTMESLLAMPLQPIEVMLGKIVPYIVVGYVQTLVILLAALYAFDVPFVGSLMLLLACVFLFILANLAVGITISSTARNQTQAMQMSFFFMLPSILMTGFMFPFRGMPVWAQTVGELLPLTHFLRIVRGVMLKGSDFGLIYQEVLILITFCVIVMLVGVARYRRTLD